MMTLFRAQNTHATYEIKDVLVKHIRNLPGSISPIGISPAILRYEFPITSINLQSWLSQQPHSEKIYWADRNKSFETAGIGMADCIYKEEEMDLAVLWNYFEEHLSADNPHLRYYGGFSFQNGATDAEWKAFGTCRFWVPRFELFKENNESYLAFNIALKDVHVAKIENILEELEKINFSAECSDQPLCSFIQRTDFPEKNQWEKIFDHVSNQLKQGTYEKIVLARKSLLELQEDLNPVDLLAALKSETPDCFHFCFQPDDATAFLGASPERLYKRTGRRIESEAIAGTIPRGKTDAEDERFQKDLCQSAKDVCEQQFVVDAVKNSLTNFCTQINYNEELQVLTLNSGHHLFTQFEGMLNEKSTDDAILTELHPTPAVGGSPTQAAVEAITTLEPFTRGWYAAPVGYVGFDTAEFIVAIRSALLKNKELSLYAGAGIVEGSTAEAEWQEIEHKMGNFMRIFV